LQKNLRVVEAMAEMESSQKEWVEGFDETGKPLERITKSEQLQEQQRKMKKEEVELNKALQKEQFEMLELQNKLKECNDEYTQERQHLDELRSQQRVTLDTDQKFRILSVTKETIDRFLRRRPKLEDEQMVDVHFLTGTETTGFNLHINGEGAGSRDAKFLVHLNEKVESLGKQAAKYWGLDPDKVFFLDGDGRIVLDNMTLVDIILPPVPPTDPHFRNSQSSSSTALVPEAAPSGEQRDRDLWMVKGRNYCLTLVRASTVLSKEDLNRPKGEKWEDFTFNERQLEKELENARKKRGGEDGEAAKINMDVIPSLNDLMQQGQEKKRRRRADTRCRLLEFSVFVVCQVLFLLSLVQPQMLGPSLYLASGGLERLLANFTEADNSSAYLNHVSPSFHDIITEQQYWQWLTGPLQRVLLDDGTLEKDLHIKILRTLTTRYDATQTSSSLSSLYQFCNSTSSSGSGTVNADNTNTNTTVTATSTATQTTSTSSTATATYTSTTMSTSSTISITSSQSLTVTQTTSMSTTSISTTVALSVTATTTTSSTSTTGTNVTVPAAVVVSPGDISCIPDQFRYCSNLRTMHILGKGQELGHEVPTCIPLYDINVPNAYFQSLTHPQVFSYAHGKIGAYFEGARSFLNVSNGTEAFRQSLESFTLSTGDPFTFQGSAQQITTFVYGATTNAIFIFHFLVENRLSGGLATTLHKDVFQLDLEPVESHVYLLLACALAVVLLLMELRRIFHCPAACTFEEERSKCSIWSLLFLVLPALILSISCLMLVQDTFTGNLLQAGRKSDGELYDYLWLRIKLDRSRLTIVVITLFLFNALMLKYLLLHFPQLLSATQIVKKLAAPMITVLILICVTVFSFGVFLYTVFGTAFSAFEGVATTWLNVVLWSMGYIKDWQAYYRFQPALWTFSIFIALCLIQLTLNVLPAVIMLSHKKEADLVENYSYHAYWASERSKNSGKKSFNPALVGWDFADPKDPREVFN